MIHVYILFIFKQLNILFHFIKKEKTYKELWEIFGTKAPKVNRINYEDLQRLNYLDCVIKETLRIFPTIPYVARHLKKDIEMGLFRNKYYNIDIIITCLCIYIYLLLLYV